MKKQEKQVIAEAKSHLIEVGGRTTRDFGLGRIVGQVLMYIYLSKDDCSLDEIGAELGLSKAAASIASRQIEALGLIHKVWKRGDRRHYYRLVKDIGVALRKGLLSTINAKLWALESELDHAEEMLAAVSCSSYTAETGFVLKRLERAQRLRKRVDQVINNPVIKMLGK